MSPGRSTIELTSVDRVLPFLEALADGAVIYWLSSSIGDVRSLFQSVAGVVALDPPLQLYRLSWDALADSLGGGLANISANDVCIVWPGASEFRAAYPEDWAIWCSIIDDTVEWLQKDRGGKPRFTFLWTHTV